MIINGESHSLHPGDSDLTKLLDRLGLGGKPVVIELNGEAVRPDLYPETKVHEDDRLEIVLITAGG